MILLTRKQALLDLTKYELEYMAMHPDTQEAIIAFMAMGGFSQYTDNELADTWREHLTNLNRHDFSRQYKIVRGR
jgi:hypothetical protein